MNLALTNIIKTFTVILSGFALLSCNHDSFYYPETDTPKTEGPVLGITLSVGNTRAEKDPMDGGFEDGTGYENYLDITNGDFRMYFFEAAGDNINKYIATFTPDELPAVGVGETGGYLFKGPLPERVGTNFKLVVLANWGTNNYPLDRLDAQGNPVLKLGDESIYTIEDLTTHTFGQFSRLTSPEGEESWLSGERLIPFYGVRSYNIHNQVADKLDENNRLKEDVYVDLTQPGDELPLLRAMAKIELILENSLATFEEVKLTRTNAKGFCAPYKKSEDWKFEHTDYYKSEGGWDGNYVKGVHLTYGADTNKGNGTNDADATATSIQFKKYPRTEETDAAGKVTVTPEKWVAYVPEYKNIGVNDFTTIEVRLANPNAADTPSTAAEGDSGSGSASNGSDSGTDGAPTSDLWVKQIYFAKGCTEAANSSELGNRFDIERNNIYRFTIDGMNANLSCEVEVIPYGEVKLRYEYGFEYDSRGDLIVQYDKDTGVIDDYFKELLPDYILENHKVPLYNNKGVELTGDALQSAMLYYDDGRVIVPIPLDRLFEPDKNYDDDPDVPQDPFHEDPYIKEKDYYAIVKTGSVVYNNLSYEVWLKDSKGCRVLSNYNDHDETDWLDCHARLVADYSGTNARLYYKDREGDKRLHHYDNHSSIVEAQDSIRYYKSPSYEEQEGSDDLIPIKNTKYVLWGWDTNPKLWDVDGGRDNPTYNHCYYIIPPTDGKLVIFENVTEAQLKEGLGIKADEPLPQAYAPYVGQTVVKHAIREVGADGVRIRVKDENGNDVLKVTYDFKKI